MGFATTVRGVFGKRNVNYANGRARREERGGCFHRRRRQRRRAALVYVTERTRREAAAMVQQHRIIVVVVLYQRLRTRGGAQSAGGTNETGTGKKKEPKSKCAVARVRTDKKNNKCEPTTRRKPIIMLFVRSRHDSG